VNAAPLVSVVMTLYNKRPYVARAIESVLRQTRPEWELIVVDDGSTDGSANEVPRNDPRIRLHRQENGGVTAARNTGIRLASCPLITFLDADDYYYPDKLEHEISLLLDRRLAEWMVSSWHFEKGSYVTLLNVRDSDGREVKGAPRVIEDAPRQLDVVGWNVGSLCMSRELMERIGGFCAGLRCMDVTEFMIRAVVACPRVLIDPEPLSRVVRVPGSNRSTCLWSSNGVDSLRRIGRMVYDLYQLHPEHREFLERKSRQMFLGYACYLMMMGNARAARRFLTVEYPLARDEPWRTTWAVSWLPGPLRAFLVKFAISRRDRRRRGRAVIPRELRAHEAK
jgi:glycosyltransferase involved in cell wall biosynthesis